MYVRLLHMLLQQSELDADRVLAAAQPDLTALMAQGQPLESDVVIRLVNAALAATGKPWLGLDLGAKVPVSAHGALAFAALTAPELGSALAVLARYGAIRTDALTWALHSTAEGAMLQMVERNDWGPARGFMLDAVLASVLRVIEAALGEWPRGLCFDLPIAAPAWVEQYRRFAPVEIRFGCEVFALRAQTAALAVPCIAADARTHAAACRDCDAALGEAAARSTVQKVVAVLAAASPGPYPQLPEVARQCELSPRTLMRRLQAEGSSYQQLLDAERKARALYLLQHTQAAIETIAAELGYVDTSNFSRTVRRWFGVPPSQLRQAL